MAEGVNILMAGLPAEIVREIGLRIRGATVAEFENAQQMGRAAGQGEAALIVLSDSLPATDALYITRRAKDASDEVRIAYCISMGQAEATLHSLEDMHVDRFFLLPVDVEEMLRELAKMCGFEVLPPLASHGENIAAAVLDAWDRTRGPAFKKIDTLDDAAIAVLDGSISAELKSAAERGAQSLVEVTARFGFAQASRIAEEIAERFSGASLTPSDGVAVSEQLQALRSALDGPPQARVEPRPSHDEQALASITAGEKSADSAVHDARILVVDDEPAISTGLTTLLGRRGMVVTGVHDPLRFWNTIAEVKPGLILLDLEMPKISGTELCRAIRSDRRWSQLPVVFLTGHTDPDSVRRVFAAGADDYVGKPFVPAELIMRIESRLTGVKARRGPDETDPVTGLATAKRTTEVIERFLKLARRKSDPYSVAVLEVDAFPEVVRVHGRSVGDRVLRAIGELLPKNFRGEDVVGWWGWWAGAEFMIGMYGSSKEHSAIKLNQICMKIGEQTFKADDGSSVQVTCSGGVAQYQIDGDTVDALRESGLEAIKLARETGLSRVGISGVMPTGPLTRRVDVAIVDDDKGLVLLLQHAMESRSMRVATFTDGATAANALSGAVPEVQARIILLDVDLPSLNGLDVLRRLNAVDVTRATSVIMLTARTGERDVLASLELGAIDHIAKPFSVPVLMHKVRTLLKQGQ
ncbi:MAG TPA: response regulator [Gemmatimonadaceae bacterium]|nr:response regulator [Gemmatimonadaceae bacterium]